MFSSLMAGRNTVNLNKARKLVDNVERKAFINELMCKAHKGDRSAAEQLLKVRSEVKGLRDFLVVKSPDARSEIQRLSHILRPVGSR